MASDDERQTSESRSNRTLRRQFNILKQRRDVVVRTIERLFKISSKDLEQEEELSIFLSRFSSLQDDYQSFLGLTNELRELAFDLNLDVEASEVDIEERVECQYYKINAVASRVVKETPATSRGGHSTAPPSLRLPNISIPCFDGNLANFKQFFDLFTSLIDSNQSLTDIEKYHYLLSSLKGQALALVSSLPIISDNYVIAWRTLVQQYENKRLLAFNYLDKLFSMRVHTDSVDALQNFFDVFSENVNALNAMNIPNLSEFVLFYVAAKALDKSVKKQFEIENHGIDFPSISHLLEFGRKYVNILRTSGCKQIKFDGLKSSTWTKGMSQKTTLISTSQPDRERRIKCQLCDSHHRLYQCPHFNSLSVSKRRDFIKSKGICFNCLAGVHKSAECASKYKCRHCSSRHHSLLCTKDTPMQGSNSKSDEGSEVTKHAHTSRELSDEAQHSSTTNNAVVNSMSCMTNSHAQPTAVLLGTAVALVQTQNGTVEPIRMIVDPASQASFVTTDCQQRLGLLRRKMSVHCLGLSGTPVCTTHGVTSFTMRPRNNDTEIQVSAIVIHKITSCQPSFPVPGSVSEKFSSLDLADPNFFRPGQIDFLLGADLYSDVMTEGPIIRLEGLPSAWPSIFGYIILGPIAPRVSNYVSNIKLGTLTTCFTSVENDLNSSMQNFWNIEELPSIKSISPEDRVAEEQFKTLHYRNPDGSYVVPLLLKDKYLPLSMSGSQTQAIKRFTNLDCKLKRNSELNAEYTAFLKEYLDLGHMSPAKWGSGKCYIPHYAVMKPFSSTTKVRVVFDGSSKTSSGKSLNDFLLKGPKLQQDISDLIIRFRLHSVALVADICKMYRMIHLLPQDRIYQHIIWRSSDNESFQEYELNTVTYGLTSSPYLAIRTLKQLSKDEVENFPQACSVLSQDFFVDDLLTGASSESAATELIKELQALLQSGGFQLRKWSSNIPKVLENLPIDLCQSDVYFRQEGDHMMKVLGIHWEPTSDTFSYHINVFNSSSTKRGILSTIAKLFDPLGWISPAVFWAKCLMQELWKLNLGWDDPVPHNLLNVWENFVSQLPALSKIKLKRIVAENLSGDLNGEFNLLGFCDASEKGYAAVVYLRSGKLDKQGQVSLLMAKTRVAPIKTVSIPRLELLGAVLLSGLIEVVFESLSKCITISSVYAWSDSSVVLSWLKTPQYLLKTFVCHRVLRIVDSPVKITWNHISTKCNPADCASRGLLPSQLIAQVLWWNGPSWISYPYDQWEISNPKHIDVNELPESKSHGPVFTIHTTTHVDLSFIDRFSSLPRLQRVIAYCLRFIAYVHPMRKRGHTGILSLPELSESLIVCVRATQMFSFKKDIKNLRLGLPCSTALQKLTPFLDPRGCIRVGGRLNRSCLDYENKHPLLLPKNSTLTNLIIDYYHKTYNHAGSGTLLNLLSRKFWIVSARQAIRTRIYKCAICFKLRATPTCPLMGDLPPSRVRPSRPFYHTGVDFGGPFYIKESLRRNAKISKAYL